MIIRAARFNIYLLLLAALTVTAGCQTAESRRKKQIAVLRVHLEVFRDGTKFSEQVSIGRNSPMTVNVQRGPFLTEDEVASAKIVEAFGGGFGLQIQFDRRGTILLEQYTASNPRKRLAIFTQFGEKLDRARWLAAPMIYQRISDGVLTFTPDADRKETAQIELGLNNHARKTQPKASKDE
jgi:preprotein translocase subunit SecD